MKCPNPSSFNIEEEYEKDKTTWRLDFAVSYTLFLFLSALSDKINAINFLLKIIHIIIWF